MKKFLKRFWWIILLFLGSGILITRKKMFNLVNTWRGKVKDYCPINEIDPDLLDIANKINKEMIEKHNINLVDRFTSGYRCQEYNRKIGGTEDSSHLKGLAIDQKMSPEEADKFIQIAKKYGVKRFLFKSGEGQHLHWDIDPDKPAIERWI